MAQVTVTIAGKIFRMACGDGEEAHLEGLAKKVDDKVSELRQAFGEIGDQRLTMMASIAIADEANDAQQKIAELTAELANLKQERQLLANTGDIAMTTAADAIDNAAARIEHLAQEMRNSSKG